jgi:hypothetical protein
MLELNLMGNNSVGRMYRPDKILNSEKRGFILFTKYKPNFGGSMKSLQIELNLEYNLKDKTEVVKVDIVTEDKTKVAVGSERFEDISKKRVKTKTDDINIDSVRNFVKPDGYNLRKKSIPAKIKNDRGVLFMDIFVDSNKEEEKEIISLIIYPSVIDNTEYIVVDADAKTPIIVTNENGVHVVE